MTSAGKKLIAAALTTAAFIRMAFAEQPDKWVRYVESTGSQWVDTGVIGRPNTKIEAKVEKGVLNVRLPKIEKVPRTEAIKHIAIQ